MDATLTSAIRRLLAGIGVLVGALIILMSISSIQGMSPGQERLADLLFFFCISFAIGFGLGATSAMVFSGRYKAWPTARAFAAGGAVGGVFMALVIEVMDYFEPQLRVSTHGGPIGAFLLAGIFVAITLAVFVGTTLLRRAGQA